MKLNSKVTGALAWAGLLVIIAVPSAEMLFGKPATPKANLTSDMDQVKPAVVSSVKPVVKQVVATPTSDPAVKEFVRSGKKLPSYISDNPVVDDASIAPAVKPAPVVKKPGTITINPDGTIAKDEPATDLASVPLAPQVAAPKPYPASMRPKAPVTTEVPLVIDENAVAEREPAPVVRGDQLEEWDSGSLADYLERKGLMSDGETANSSATFDEDGFFLSDGPNGNNRSRVRRYEDNDLLF